MNHTEESPVSILYPDGKKVQGEAEIVSEHNLTVLINEKAAYRLVCTKDHLKELVAGRLKTDGFIESADDIYRIYFCKYENEASVFLNREIAWEETLQADLTCCTGNRVYAAGRRAELKKLPSHEMHPEWVFALTEEFGRGTKLHDRTAGVHVCILAREGKILFVSEDIGRHNAVDKAVGYALLNGIPLLECMIFTSGRVPTDMVEKVIAAGIPVLVSKSVPTAESVRMAKDHGLSLICRAWPDKCEIFAE